MTPASASPHQRHPPRRASFPAWAPTSISPSSEARCPASRTEVAADTIMPARDLAKAETMVD